MSVSLLGDQPAERISYRTEVARRRSPASEHASMSSAKVNELGGSWRLIMYSRIWKAKSTLFTSPQMRMTVLKQLTSGGSPMRPISCSTEIALGRSRPLAHASMRREYVLVLARTPRRFMLPRTSKARSRRCVSVHASMSALNERDEGRMPLLAIMFRRSKAKSMRRERVEASRSTVQMAALGGWFWWRMAVRSS